MLQSIRDSAQGWIAWVIVILISIPFALWGIQSYLGVGGVPVVAKVNGVEITERDFERRVQMTRANLREQLGAAYDSAGIDDVDLRRQVLKDMVQQALLVDVAERMGFRVSDQELRAVIASEPAFQRDGRFDQDTYKQLLSMQGMSPQMFAESRRQEILGTQLVRGVIASELVTSAERDALLRLQGQQREISWVRFPAKDFASEQVPGGAQIKTYYDAHGEAFQTPEQVKLDYLVLDIAALAESRQISDDALRQAYESEQARFGQPERREVRHILLTVPPGADDAKEGEVRDEILGVRERITNGGESFDAVAKEVSQDPGSAAQGGSLGEIEPGIMDPVFDEAAFALEPGVVSEPVRTRFGFHLIEVDSVAPASVKPFDEVREQLRNELAKREAESLYYDLGDRLANLVYESPDSLEPAAEALGLEIQHSDWIDRRGADGVFASPKVTAAAFSDEVLVEGRNSDPIEPEKDVLKAVVIRVADHHEAAVRPLEEVRGEIISALQAETARNAAIAAAQAAAKEVQAGAALSEVASDRSVESPGLVARNAQTVPPPVRSVAFSLPVPANDAKSVGTASFGNGDAAVVQVSLVADADPAAVPQAQQDRESAALTRLLGRASYDAVLADMESRAEIERKPVDGPDEG